MLTMASAAAAKGPGGSAQKSPRPEGPGAPKPPPIADNCADRVTDDGLAEFAVKLLQDAPELCDLDFSGNQELTDVGLSRLAEKLSSSATVVILNFRVNKNFTDECLTKLARKILLGAKQDLYFAPAYKLSTYKPVLQWTGIRKMRDVESGPGERGMRDGGGKRPRGARDEP